MTEKLSHVSHYGAKIPIDTGEKIPIDTKFDYITEAATKQGDCLNPVVNRVVRRIRGKNSA